MTAGALFFSHPWARHRTRSGGYICTSAPALLRVTPMGHTPTRRAGAAHGPSVATRRKPPQRRPFALHCPVAAAHAKTWGMRLRDTDTARHRGGDGPRAAVTPKNRRHHHRAHPRTATRERLAAALHPTATPCPAHPPATPSPTTGRSPARAVRCHCQGGWRRARQRAQGQPARRQPTRVGGRVARRLAAQPKKKKKRSEGAYWI